MMTDSNNKDTRFSKWLSTVEKGKVSPDRQFLNQLQDKALEEFETYAVESEDQFTAPTTSIWRISVKSPITKIAAVAVLIIAALIGINQFGGSVDVSSVAFGQVLEYFHESSYTFDLMVTGQSTSKDLVPINAKGMVVQTRKLRLDWVTGDGEVSAVVDYDVKQFLQLFHKDKLGRISAYTGKTKGDFSLLFNKPVEKLWDLKDGSEEFLGEKELDGRAATGFKVIQDGYQMIIWADSNSGLPLNVSAISEATNDSLVPIKWVLENFDFENEIDEELFSLDGPAEYTIVNKLGKVVREGVTTHKDESINEATISTENAAGLLIKPLEGVGAVKFGMTREQITEILGKPDQVIGKHCLDYTSTAGLSLLVHSKRGLLAIDCWSKAEHSDEGHIGGSDFAGKTDKGIGINSTKDDIVSLYGKGSNEYLHKRPDIFELPYPQLNTIFRLKDNKIIHISMTAPR